MGRFFRDRLDRLAGLASESEYENAVYRERFIALRRQLPWLYATLCIFFPMGVVTGREPSGVERAV